MGNYVNGALLPNEQVVSEAHPHWAIFIAPGIVLLLGLMIEPARGFLILVAMIWAIFRFLVYQTTELAVTNKRVIAKSGIVSRNVVDVSLSKIEGVTYNQTVIGRLAGYGSVLVRGTGVGQVPIRFISQPEHFKHEVGRLLHDD